MKRKYIVTLTQEQREKLQAMLSRGKAAARKLRRYRGTQYHFSADPGISGDTVPFFC